MGFLNRLFGNQQKTATTPPPQPEPPSFAYELLCVPGSEAVAKAKNLRNEWRGSHTPIILGPKDEFENLADLLSQVPESPEEILRRSMTFDLEPWITNRVEESAPLAELTDPAAWRPGDAQAIEFAAVTKGKEFHPWVWIARIPTAHPFEAPAWLKFGNWNACPSPEDHVALWRRWQEKYGAEILCVTGDVIEATVSRPPESKEACYALAREQFAYCDDIVTQGVGSIDALATAVHRSPYWFFWWD
jgi:hypothetical protein